MLKVERSIDTSLDLHLPETHILLQNLLDGCLVDTQELSGVLWLLNLHLHVELMPCASQSCSDLGFVPLAAIELISPRRRALLELYCVLNCLKGELVALLDFRKHPAQVLLSLASDWRHIRHTVY